MAPFALFCIYFPSSSLNNVCRNVLSVDAMVDLCYVLVDSTCIQYCPPPPKCLVAEPIGGNNSLGMLHRNRSPTIKFKYIHGN